MQKRVCLYLRVSTGGQTVENQRQALEAACRAKGWTIQQEFVDAGISGAKGRDKRPGFDAMLKAVARGQVNMVAAWSVDRLGRSMQDLVGFLGELKAAECDLFLERQAIDTTTPSGRAMFQMIGIFAEFEREIMVERINAGIARARVHGTKSGAPIGRAKSSPETVAAILAELAKGTAIVKTARTLGVGTSLVQRIKANR